MSIRSLVVITIASTTLFAPLIAAAADHNVLVFSRTAGFRHDSIPEGIKAIQEIAADRFHVDATEDPAVFTTDNLARYHAVVFLNTTGDVLNDEQQLAFEGFIKSGKGYVGVHAAADTEYDWPWYGRLVGAYFKSHPRIQPAIVNVHDRTHPSTLHLPESWPRTDEWYNYRANPRKKVHVLASLDTTSYEGSAMDGDHPIAWWHEMDGGRALYTGGGHTKECFRDKAFRQHLLGAILWAAGAEPSPTDKKKAPDTRPSKDENAGETTDLAGHACGLCRAWGDSNAEQVP